jgi:carbon starvation protein CstA
MNPNTINLLVTIIVFGLLGWVVARSIARRLSDRMSITLTILLALTASLTRNIREDIWICGVDEYGMPLKIAMIALSLGASFRFLIHVLSRQRVVNTGSGDET